MKTIINLFFPVVALFLFQSCEKKEDENNIVICPVTFSTIFKWREDSINAGKTGTFSKIDKGNELLWVSNQTTLDKSGYGIYHDMSNIMADFAYTILPDSVFTLQLTADSVYFYDRERNVRTDLKGHITYAPVPRLVLYNTGVSPTVTIQYKLEE